MKVKPVVMAGGIGTRLWPISRRLFPKQFVKISGDLSLLQKTLLRNKVFGNQLVILNKEHKFLALEQIREIGVEAEIILEPLQRNTFACSVLGTLYAKTNGDDVLLLTPSDHYIHSEEQYLNTINTAIVQSAICDSVTIGVSPTFPSTGYGYIKVKDAIDDCVYKTEEFIEKPSLEYATKYVLDGGYFWNSGIFIYDINRFLDVTKALQPILLKQVIEAFEQSNKIHGCMTISEESYSPIVSISIDNAIMEKMRNMIMVKSSFDWCDIGNWHSLWKKKSDSYDDRGNYISGDIIMKNVRNSYIMSDKLVAVVGVDNLVVVNTEDATLIADKSKTEEVKQIVEELEVKNRIETVEHKKIFRPWGYYHTLIYSQYYQVKQIVVYPNHKLSLQYHHHRSEHWVIVQGVAEVTVDDIIKTIASGSYIYIPKSAVHRLINVGDIDLFLIEVQVGSYLGEDDIVRIEDIYGRSYVYWLAIIKTNSSNR